MVDRQVVMQTLDEVAAQGLPTGADLWPVVRERALRRRRCSSVARWVPATRLGWAALARCTRRTHSGDDPWRAGVRVDF